ncbi:MAG TPA: N-formylglutamate amidohydrolase [Chlamydiales bacterium]|nr:N-formylglutamate amidohydrolase [Chlamydiales bacterium]
MMTVVITCEHAGRVVPEKYKPLFTDFSKLLETHRGYDLGAYSLAQQISKELGVTLDFQPVSRLVIDMNRSLDNPSLFSEVMKPLQLTEKQEIIDLYYTPYREKVRQRVAQALHKSKKVLHLSIHSFTPVMDGKVRQVDIGLLFDPQRSDEQQFCSSLRDALSQKSPYRVLDNEPYLGTDDGLTTTFRTLFGKRYSGIEIEVNQKFAQFERDKDGQIDRKLSKVLVDEIKNAVARFARENTAETSQ